jgi:ParB family chromosome partitioning protein
MSAKNVKIVQQSGTESFIPLNKLKKSPKNTRKTPHSEASIEAYAASVAAKGILQNLVVEPELDADGGSCASQNLSCTRGIDCPASI